MEVVRIPVITEATADNPDIYTDYSALATNVITKKRADGRYYYSQRPSFDYYSTGGTGSIGDNNRGVYYAESSGAIYVVNDTKMWSLNLGTEYTPATNASAFASNGMRVYGTELNGNVFFIDPAGNQGKWMDILSGVSFYDMDLAAGNGSGTFTYFPPNNSLTLSHGVAVIDRTMYVLCTNKTIWGSDLNDGTSWTSGTNYITVEKYDDVPKLIDSHNNHVVYFGSNSVQFFYDAGNSTGSPLSLREDISYKVGLTSTESYYKIGETIYFIGSNGGNKSLYKLENFQLTPIYSPYLSEMMEKTTKILLSHVSYSGNEYIVLTPYAANGTDYIADSSNQISLIYDVTYGQVTSWTSPVAADGIFSVRHFAYRHFSNQKYVYMRNGDYMIMTNELQDYDVTTTDDYVNSLINIKLPAFDNGNNKWKFFNSLELIGEELDVSTSVSIYWRDENTGASETVSGSRTLNLLYSDRKIKRMGRAKRRSYSIQFQINSDTESKIALEAIEIEFDEGES